MSDVLVLGAGPAGLMAAYEAAREGHYCTVLEAAPHVGGMAGSFELAGLRVDFGSHRLHPASPPPLLQLIGELLGDDLQVRPRQGRLLLDGHWVGFPLRTTELLRALPPGLGARLVSDSVRSSARALLPSRTARSFDDEVTARLGPTVADRFYGPYARKLYGIDPSRLDRELARRRVSASSPAAVARRLFRAARPGGRTFLYPRQGYGQIAERLAEAAVDAGASIRVLAEVTSVELEADRVTVHSGDRSVDADIVLSTLPLTTLASVLAPAPPRAVTAALGRVRSRAMILAYLVLDRAQYTPFDAHYVPASDTRIARLSEPKNYRDGDDPPDRTVLCAEIPCWPSEDIWEWSDTEIGAMVADDLDRLGLPLPDAVACETRRLPSVYPVYDLGGADDRVTIDDWGRGHRRLVTLGRQGLRVIDNLHHVLAMGAAAVGSIALDGTIDGDSWHHHLDDFALNVVED